MKKVLDIRKDCSNDNLAAYIIVDEKTGVNYITCKYYTYGEKSGGVAMVPRLNEDGSLYITK